MAYEYVYQGKKFMVSKSMYTKRWFAFVDSDLVKTVKPCATRKDAIQAARNYIDALFSAEDES